MSKYTSDEVIEILSNLPHIIEINEKENLDKFEHFKLPSAKFVFFSNILNGQVYAVGKTTGTLNTSPDFPERWITYNGKNTEKFVNALIMQAESMQNNLSSSNKLKKKL